VESSCRDDERSKLCRTNRPLRASRCCLRAGLEQGRRASAAGVAVRDDAGWHPDTFGVRERQFQHFARQTYRCQATGSSRWRSGDGSSSAGCKAGSWCRAVVRRRSRGLRRSSPQLPIPCNTGSAAITEHKRPGRDHHGSRGTQTFTLTDAEFSMARRTMVPRSLANDGSTYNSTAGTSAMVFLAEPSKPGCNGAPFWCRDDRRIQGSFHSTTQHGAEHQDFLLTGSLTQAANTARAAPWSRAR